MDRATQPPIYVCDDPHGLPPYDLQPAYHGRKPRLDALTALVTSLWRLSEADIACVHRLTMAETTEARASRRPDFRTINTRTGLSSLGTGFTRQLEKGLPTLYWKTLFGPPYVELFGQQTLLAAPAFEIIEGLSGISVQLTAEGHHRRNVAGLPRRPRVGNGPPRTRCLRARRHANLARTMRTFDPRPWPESVFPTGRLPRGSWARKKCPESRCHWRTLCDEGLSCHRVGPHD